MKVIRHGDKAEKQQSFLSAETIEGVHQHALHNGTLEDMSIVNGFGCDKIEVLGNEVGTPV
ncbi:MAG: hypothetical protein HY023_10865 [Chloroflexi bacterium]|nr:hypothetical protein [Chloroflexota bacterium]MBI3764116.1 hypothetical protein [Chloroflexota bacterium]